MTNKEKILMINNIIENSDLTIYYKNCLKEIINDLEILDILKRCFKNNDEYTILLLRCNYQNKIKFKEITKIKEWVRDDIKENN